MDVFSPSAWMHRAKQHVDMRVLLVVLFIGLTFRVAFLVENRHASEIRAPGLDALFHDHMARVLVGLDAPLPDGVLDPHISKTPFQRPPAYPLVLGILYRGLTDHWLAPRLLAMLLSLLLAALLVFTLAKSGVRGGALLLTGVLFVTSPSLLFFEGELMPEAPLALLVFLLVCVALRAVRSTSLRDAAWLGLVSGLLTVTRPNLALPALFVALVVAWHARVRVPLHRQWPHALLFFVVFALPIAPVTWRNVSVADAFTLVSQNGATTLLYGNNPRADGVHMNLPDDALFAGVDDVSPFTSERFRTALSAVTGRALSAADVDALLIEQVMRFVRDDPARFLTLTVKKSLLFFGPARIGNNREIAVAIDESVVLRFLPHTSIVFFSLAGLGVLALYRRRREDPATGARLSVSLAVAIGLFISVVPFVAAERFRLPLIGVLALLAGHGIAELAHLFRARREIGARPLVARLALLGAFVLVMSIPFVPVAPDRARFLFERARAYARLGELAHAERILDEAIALAPDALDALREKGFRRLGAGDARGAIHVFDRALALSRADHGALVGRGTARLQLGDAIGARDDLDHALRRMPDDERALYNRALARSETGDIRGAVVDLEHLLTLAPTHDDARNNLGRALLKEGDVAGALHAFETVLTRKPTHEEAAFNRTVALTAIGRRADAARALDDILGRDPTHVRALMNRGVLHLDDGLLDDAIALFQRARAVDPDHAYLSMNLARAFALKRDADAALRALDDVERSMARGRVGPPKPARTEMRIRALLLEPTDTRSDEAVMLAQRLVNETREAPFALALLANVQAGAALHDAADATRERLRMVCARTRARGDPACNAHDE
jgi:tetratricopeptide (TPR) repeat protein